MKTDKRYTKQNKNLMNKHNQKSIDMINKQNVTVYLTHINN